MAFPLVLHRLLNRSHLNRLRTPFLMGMRLGHGKQKTHDDFRIRPRHMFDNPSMFSVSKIKKYWEVIPIIVISLGSFVILQTYNIRTALTRDDVRWFKGSKMNCEIVEMDRKKPPKIRKFRVINQKYETPEGLIRALEGPKDKDKKKNKRKDEEIKAQEEKDKAKAQTKEKKEEMKSKKQA